eukprot:CAMPEP_0205855978 /NCGR_PEP_ID=MMETSP1083-20121108/2886_1 /ASSEMBLY_ACC=CAM_ASM_000430 /TAXON_ID=97485 /ORGANISM="Prymnesium parvum, Strain Texoma1" /LENGTH=74 /DNA_ID=CAMNT_0053217375 /DNA_START=518 /DNA_END=740 /DNA_ORIENTATION=+
MIGLKRDLRQSAIKVVSSSCDNHALRSSQLQRVQYSIARRGFAGALSLMAMRTTGTGRSGRPNPAEVGREGSGE